MKPFFCIISGNRAEYSFLFNLMKLFLKNKKIKTDIVATGAHLMKTYGNTSEEFHKDKIKIHEVVNLNQKKDTKYCIVNAVAVGVKKFTKLFKKKKYKSIVIFGDRYEIFSSAIAAYFLNIPICHISGGDVTTGSLDDGLRHSISKMSHLHFVSNYKSCERLIRMGEEKRRIFNVGTLSLDGLSKIKFLNKKTLEKKLTCEFRKKNYLITYHPETIDSNSYKKDLLEIFSSLKKLNNCSIFFTSPNNDANSLEIIKMIKEFIRKKNNCYFFESLGRLNYFSMLRNIDCVIGNSSSGIIETPSFKVPSINIGNRQKGRSSTTWTINCKANSKYITRAINYINSSKFKKKREKNFYKKKNSCLKVYSKIVNYKFPKSLFKNFNEKVINL
jgi:GDP/UDP-N,N'-diacetylbacillosamine 2-epimerase (hydrolysing)